MRVSVLIRGLAPVVVLFALGGCATVPPPIVRPPVETVPSVRVESPIAPAAPVAVIETPAIEAPTPSPIVAPTGTPTRLFRGQPEDQILEAMRTRPVVRVIERFNSSTLVFHIDLGDGVEIGFKPARRGEHGWWRHEIAGYRLARALGILDRVPPAITRRIPFSALHGFTRGARLIATGRPRMVDGAAIYWMPVLRHSNLQSDEAVHEWNTWFDPERPVPPEHRVVAGELATLLVFDYLQANFDRWNAANTPMDEHGDLVLRDNNRAWYTQNLRLLNRGGIEQIRRVPASVLAGVTAVTAAVLRAEVESDPGRRHGGLLRHDYDWYARRRQVLLDRLAGLIQRYGRDAILSW